MQLGNTQKEFSASWTVLNVISIVNDNDKLSYFFALPSLLKLIRIKRDLISLW
jgi:hypothetical protein